MSGFDFPAYKAAFQARDVDRWLEFYADDADWFEFRADHPPRAPHHMHGREQIGAFLRQLADAPMEMALTNEVLAAERSAFTLTVTFGEGGRILGNVIIEHCDGRIVRQTDVEARD